MTPEEQDLAFRLATYPGGKPRLSLEDFLERTGIIDPIEWSLTELDDAIVRRDADDAEAALVVSAVAGRDRRWARPATALCWRRTGTTCTKTRRLH